MKKKSIIAGVAALAGGAVLALAVPIAATAHVGVSPLAAEPGASRNFTFSALNESATASTIKLEIALPTDTPFLSVTYQPTPGWTTEVIEETLAEPATVGGNQITEAPTRIVFTADEGNGIRPGQFQQWIVSLGPIPDTGHVAFPATQTYDDGDVVVWGASPEQLEGDANLKPAPVLFINDEPSGHGAEGASGTETEHAAEVTAASGGSNTVALVLSIAALILAAVGATVAAVALRRRS